jgi:hypothetical protein
MEGRSLAQTQNSALQAFLVGPCGLDDAVGVSYRSQISLDCTGIASKMKDLEVCMIDRRPRPS